MFSDYYVIILDERVKMVPRSDLLFCFCGVCTRQLTWRPEGGMTFRATHCNKIYDAVPASIDLAYFTILQQDAKLDNVRHIKRGKLRKVHG